MARHTVAECTYCNVLTLFAGYGDKTITNEHVGCRDLLEAIQKRVKPMYHIFGHIHEGYGQFTDGTTKYINASVLTARYKCKNAPIIFELPRRAVPPPPTVGDPPAAKGC